MQLQQLKYLIAATEHGSFRAAAQALYVSQSSISVAIKDLEQELGVTVFERTSRGISLTPEGAEVAERARAIVEQLDAIESLYTRERAEPGPTVRLSVSSQHYTLVVDAFGDFASAHAEEPSALALRESYTNEIIRDVQEDRSDLGVIYLSNYNDRAIRRALAAADLAFTPLYVAQPHAIVRAGHPLASKTCVTLEDLGGYPRFEQDRGLESSSYFAEEPLAATSSTRKIVVGDNGTLSTLLGRTDGYALGTGAFPDEGQRFSVIPIETDEVMNIGFIRKGEAGPNPTVDEFLGFLSQRILAFEGPVEASSFVRERVTGQSAAERDVHRR